MKDTERTSKQGSINRGNSPYSMANMLDTQTYRVLVTTWNVGGKPPHDGVDLNEFLPADDMSDIYVLGFQEIVPLNAGNVFLVEDSEPAVKWLALISKALNKLPAEKGTPSCPKCPLSCSCQASRTVTAVNKDSKAKNLSLFQKPSLKTVCKSFRTERGKKLKSCNCSIEVAKKLCTDSCFKLPPAYASKEDSSEEDDEGSSLVATGAERATCSTLKQMKYSLVVSKQMVGIFVTIWARREVVQHIGHLRLCCVGRGILGCLGNKGCISVSMTLHQTSFCFICSHLASGEKEGDELRRNSDVLEILKNTQFPSICKNPRRKIPENILEHDMVIWLGDLNYRIALSYAETRKFLEDRNWKALFEKDQLKIEREAGRVFNRWNEGKICFPPTYKYFTDSDAYAVEVVESKKKRAPAWCDRILWRGDGIVQLYYIQGRSRLSDHRPVCAAFLIKAGVPNRSSTKSLSNAEMKLGVEELRPPRTSYMYSRMR